MRLLQVLTVYKALAETIGTFTMVFVGVGSIVLSEKYPGFPAIMIPLTWGTIIALMIVLWGGTSGAHFNPAVSFAMTLAKRLPIHLLPVYWGSQLLGGFLAILALKVVKK